MFTEDPNIDRKEAKYLIKEIASVIKKIAVSSSRTRCVVSWNPYHESSSYTDVLYPIFDKYIQVTSLPKKPTLLSIQTSLNSSGSNRRANTNSNSSHCLLQMRDLCVVSYA